MLELLAVVLFSGDVSALASPDYITREAASKRLEAHAWLAWRACDRRFSDLEQALRARRIVARVVRLDYPDENFPSVLTPFRIYDYKDYLDAEEFIRLPAWFNYILGPSQRDDNPEEAWYLAGPWREKTRMSALWLLRRRAPPELVRLALAYLHRCEVSRP